MNRSDHRKYAQPILVICAHLLICVPTFAQSYYSPQIRQEKTNRAYQKLLDAYVFNLGGAGLGTDNITPEEKAFRTLLEAKDSIRLFQRLINEANAQGQLFALFGLHLQAPDIFQSEAKKLRSSEGPPERIEQLIPIEKGKVRVARGCMTGFEDRQTVINQIEKGEWHAALKSNSRVFTF